LCAALFPCGDRCIWWLRDAYAGSSTVVLVVNFSGNPYWSASYNTNYTIRVPLVEVVAVGGSDLLVLVVILMLVE
jgi:hypothetical protein